MGQAGQIQGRGGRRQIDTAAVVQHIGRAGRQYTGRDRGRTAIAVIAGQDEIAGATFSHSAGSAAFGDHTIDGEHPGTADLRVGSQGNQIAGAGGCDTGSGQGTHATGAAAGQAQGLVAGERKAVQIERTAVHHRTRCRRAETGGGGDT